MPYVTEEDKNVVSTPIKEMLMKLIQEESGDISIKSEDEAVPSKKTKVSGIFFFFLEIIAYDVSLIVQL